jgi:DNA (cytosine-5)-methyltransferase 1
VNHDEAAIRMHVENHPGTLHLCTNVLKVDPVAPGGRLDLLWASPDCTYFSRARGGKPMKKEIRDLPWVVVKWARRVRPRVIGLENVREIEDWGPLYPSDHSDPKKRDRPIPEKRGETWAAFVQALRNEGYEVEWRVLCCADYGAPTTRERLFLIARCDGRPIVWPEPTHGEGCPLPWRSSSECIDWSIPCPSIFLTHEEALQWARTRRQATGERVGCPQRPLAEATLARIAEGIKRYLLEAEQPFILNLTHGGRLEPLDEPLRTVTAANRGEKALVVPSLIQTRNGERKGQTPRTLDIRSPLNTITAKGSQGALVSALLLKNYTGVVGLPMEAPAGTVMAKDHHSLVHAFLVKYYGQGVGLDLRDPLHTATVRARFGLVYAFLTKFYGTSTGSPLQEPAPTVTSGGGKSGGHLGLVTVTIGGEEYAIADIGMRMLTPRELARAQGFEDTYILTGNKSQKIAKIGNSVPPPVVEAIVRAQFPDHAMPAEEPGA